MKPQCARVVEGKLGRELTAEEQANIGDRVTAALRSIAVTDGDRFTKLSAFERLQEAAGVAAKRIVEDAENAQRQSQAAIAVHERMRDQLGEMTDRGLDAQDALDRHLFNRNDMRSGVQSLESRIDATRLDYMRRLTEDFEAVSPRFWGLMANPKGAGDFVRELFGNDTGNPLAKKAAAAWVEHAGSLADHFVSAGGILHRRADWHFPQEHDQVRAFEAGREKWISTVFDKLNRKMYVSDSGRLMDDGELRTLLSHSWDSIASGGASDIAPGAREGVSAVANREQARRVLHFKDADGYLEYMQEFGGRSVYATLEGHISSMARNIALMEHFGPNADREFAFWSDWAAQKESTKKPNADGARQTLDEAYRHLAGYSNGVTSPGLARAFERIRNLNVASKLGSAVLASIPDLATIVSTARYTNVSAVGSLIDGLRLIGPSGVARAELERLGLMTNSAMSAMSRFQVDSVGQSFSARMSGAILTASGLNRWTDSLRAGYAATQAHALARVVGSGETLAHIDAHDAKLLRSKGVTDTDYAVWREAEPSRTSFGKLMSPDAIYRIPLEKLEGIALEANSTPAQVQREAAIRLLGVSISERNMAVTEPGAKARFQMAVHQPKGTWSGELLRSFWQFKTFSWAFLQQHMVQRGGGQETVGGKLAYIVPLVVASTALGALANSIKDMVAGKDPRPLMGADGKVVTKNWIAAALSGGALGMYGDFLGSTATEDAKSAVASMMGPLVGTAADASSIVLGGSIKALNDDPHSNTAQRVVQFAKGLTPGANLWYTKAATDHMIFNWVQDRLNPGYLSRAVNRARKSFGNEYWYDPRNAVPSRPPNVASVVGKK